MPSVLDSGILGCIEPRPVGLSQLQSACAHQSGVPTTTIHPEVISIVDAELAKSKLTLPKDGLRFGEFLKVLDQDSSAWYAFARMIFSKIVVLSPSFPHPLFRILMNHYSVRLFLLHTLYHRAGELVEDPRVYSWDVFEEDFGFRLALCKSNSGILMFGPTATDRPEDTKSSTTSFEALRSSVATFETQLTERIDTLKSGANTGLLSSHEEVLRSAFVRPKISETHLVHEATISRQIIDHWEGVSDKINENERAPIFYSKLAAAAYSLLTTSEKEARFNFRSFIEDGEPVAMTAALKRKRKSLELTETPGSVAEDTARLRAALGFRNWSVFVSESLTLLIGWLQFHSGTIPDETEKLFGERLARYLTFLFNADECSIYRVRAKSLKTEFVSYAQYSRFQSPDDRPNKMATHLTKLVGEANQQESIAIRAFTSNVEQYCVHFNQETGVARPTGQTLSYPRDHPDEDWGRSACAIPIRISGIFWGVIELVSIMPHAFRETVRAKIQEAISVFAPHVSQREVFSAVGELNDAITSPEGFSLQREHLGDVMQRLLGAKSLAILTREEGGSDRVFLHVDRGDLVQLTDATQVSKSSSLDDFRSQTEDVYLLNATEQSRMKPNRPDASSMLILARIPWKAGIKEVNHGVVVIEPMHVPVAQENWQAMVRFVCQTIGNTIGGIYSKEVWENSIRQRSAHEFKKSVGGLKWSNKKLEPIVRRLETRKVTDNDRWNARIYYSDYLKHTFSIERMTSALEGTEIDPAFAGEPNFGFAASVVEAWEEQGRPQTSIQDTLNHALRTAQGTVVNQDVNLPEKFSLPNVDVVAEEWCLIQVLQTLANNALKYARPKSNILVTERSTSNFGIRISNIGPRLDAHEERKMMQDQARGRMVRQLEYPGNGYGLYYANVIATKFLGCELIYGHEELNEPHDDWTWHRLTLVFPRNLVRTAADRRER
ncbi:ATP-binding protein [uncultured Tateyamaria sp.]|uniref:ATP-binding protein n=1 Tax=uncultured Tateyamaria sp. TaxID=455651 RepID=UPI0026125369|nr:ATP-binding protein [uncultured Tateyamaria sp.]